MLTHQAITAILPVRDLERAKRFYEETLGLRERESPEENSLVLEGGEGSLMELQQREDAAPSQHTVLGFQVEDLHREIGDLESRGVKFDDYDTPELKTVEHIAEVDGHRAAWFRDPDGNILCIHERD